MDKEKRNRASKFVELAEKRVNRLLNDIKLVANLSNRSNYEYTSEQANKIINRIDEELKVLKMSFRKNVNRSNKFKL